MPAIFPFRAVQYQGGRGDVSALIAPPYDVLDASAKQALLANDPRNVVAIDLPHTPAKDAGPPRVYQQAAATFRQWLREGVLSVRPQPAMFVYRQTFTSRGRASQRTGLACTVEVAPFGPRAGGGILPHEETFAGPKADRLALLRATHAQFSPVFGLYPDDDGAGTRLLATLIARTMPEMTARTPDGIVHEVWTISAPGDLRACQEILAGKDVFIADGHHRYTTAINYLTEQEQQRAVPADDPARRCLMVLVAMSDPGLVIWPTHRVLGGMRAYTLGEFLAAMASHFHVRQAGPTLAGAAEALDDAGPANPPTIGLYDYDSRTGYVATARQHDPLAPRFPDRPAAWRTLDVAIVQHLVIEDICQSRLNGGVPPRWAFPHTLEEILRLGTGEETGAGGGFTPQLAVLVRPTPLAAIRAVCAAGQLMPQKSTFFYPKLATGLFIHPLRWPIETPS